MLDTSQCKGKHTKVHLSRFFRVWCRLKHQTLDENTDALKRSQSDKAISFPHKNSLTSKKRPICVRVMAKRRRVNLGFNDEDDGSGAYDVTHGREYERKAQQPSRRLRSRRRDGQLVRGPVPRPVRNLERDRAQEAAAKEEARRLFWLNLLPDDEDEPRPNESKRRDRKPALIFCALEATPIRSRVAQLATLRKDGYMLLPHLSKGLVADLAEYCQKVQDNVFRPTSNGGAPPHALLDSVQGDGKVQERDEPSCRPIP